MTTLAVLLFIIGVWLVTGCLGAGIGLAYYQGEYAVIRTHEIDAELLKKFTVLACGGPEFLLAVVGVCGIKHGIRFRISPPQS